MAESQFAGLVALAAGAFCIVAAIGDWDWFMNSRKAKAWVKRIGRRNARRAYGGLGVFVAMVGLVMVLVAPGSADDVTTAQTNNTAPDAGPQNSSPPVAANAPTNSNTPDPQREVAIAEIPKGGIDLLPLIDPSRDQLAASWSMQGGHLISPTARPAIMQVPVELPDSYSVVAVVEELEATGNGSFSLGINVAGNGVSVVVAGTNGDTSGLQLVDNQITRSNSTHRRGPVMQPGRNQIVCQVDGNRVQVLCNDEVIIDWDDDPSRLSYGYESKKGRADQLKIGSWSASFRISKLTLVP